MTISKIKAQISNFKRGEIDQRLRCDVTVYRPNATIQKLVFNCTSRTRETVSRSKNLGTEQWIYPYVTNRRQYPSLMLGHALPRQQAGVKDPSVRNNICEMLIAIWHDPDDNMIVGDLYIDNRKFRLDFTDAVSEKQQRAGYEMDATWAPELPGLLYRDGQYINKETGEIQ